VRGTDQLVEVSVAEVAGEAVVLSPIQLPTPLKVQLFVSTSLKLNYACRNRRINA